LIGSPVIANVYLDTVLDQWFAKVVSRHCRGYCTILRYADDALALFEHEDDAKRFLRILPLRLEKFGLRLNPQKTRLLICGKRPSARIGKPLMTIPARTASSRAPRGLPPVTTPAALLYPMLRRVPRPRFAALRLASGRFGGAVAPRWGRGKRRERGMAVGGGRCGALPRGRRKRAL